MAEGTDELKDDGHGNAGGAGVMVFDAADQHASSANSAGAKPGNRLVLVVVPRPLPLDAGKVWKRWQGIGQPLKLDLPQSGEFTSLSGSILAGMPTAAGGRSRGLLGTAMRRRAAEGGATVIALTKLDNIDLWDLDRPNLYAVTPQPIGSGQVVDEYSTRVVLKVTNAEGDWRPFSSGAVTLKIEGPGKIVGENPFSLVGGAGAVWVKTKEGAGLIRIEANHPRLSVKNVEIQVKAAEPEVV